VRPQRFPEWVAALVLTAVTRRGTDPEVIVIDDAGHTGSPVGRVRTRAVLAAFAEHR
jgi:hypothetical protein